jgi:adenosylhomocysteine nucleosidase
MTTVSGGVNTFGGTVTNNGPVAGRDVVHGTAPQTASGPAPQRRSADVGVLTILDQEIRAVRAVLQRMSDYRETRLGHGPLAREARLPGPGGRPIRIAAVQTLTRGTDSAALAYRGLVAEYNPSVVLLVGIAGGVSPKVEVGDVVLSDEVISYDARREAPDGTHRRGQAQSVAAPLGHRLNDFFAATPEELRSPDGESFRIHRGPIGSGNAVVTDAGSEIRRWLSAFNEKVLAVETEAAGVAQSFHESVEHDAGPRGWLTVRGISDTADRHKGYAYHDLAARHAAEVMGLLVPYLDVGQPS